MLNSQHPMWIGWGHEGTFLYNDAYLQVLGQAKHPWALGKPASVVWSEIWDVCGPLADKVYREGKASFVDNVRLFMNRADYIEETFYSFSYSPIFDETGKVGGLFCPSNEITDKLLNERRLRTLSELTARSYLEKTIDGAAKSAATTLAKNPDDIPFALLYLEDPGRGEVVLKEAVGLQSGRPGISPEVVDLDRPETSAWPLAEVLSHPDGRVVPVSNIPDLPLGLAGQTISEVLVLPVSATGQERPAGVLVAGVSPARKLDREYRTFFDLVAGQVGTAVRSATHAEEERRRTEALAELDRAKSHFFSNVSHELRTPLTLLLGPMEESLRGPRRALEGDNLEVAHRNALRLLKLVNTLLDFSRIEAGRLQASFQRVDLPALTRDVAAVFKTILERAGLRFVVDCPPLAEEVYVDPSLWEKVLLNLLSNAYKFTFEGEVRVRLRSGDHRVQLEVADTGTGIPEKELPRLFERFHRIHGAKARSYEGSGIGLALVKEIILLHGGTVAVESHEGKGTTFRIELPTGKEHLPKERTGTAAEVSGTSPVIAPFVQEAASWTAVPAARGTDPTPSRPAPVTERILVVDDNPDMRSYVERLLRGRWVVETAADGVDALARARDKVPDLVLSDVMMPRLDGLGLLEALRKDERTRTLPVILLSARAGEESRIEGLDWGADDYLVKPFSAAELIARVSSHLKLARLRRESESARRQSEDLVRTALGAGRMFAWELNLETGQAHVSEGVTPVIGAPQDLSKEQAWPNVHPEDEPAIRSTMKAAIQHAGTFSHQVRFRRFDTGEWIWLEVRGEAPRDADGAVRRIVGLAIDVTERERVESALRESERSLRSRSEEILAIMESTPAFVWVAQDPDGHSIVGNRASYELLRMEPGTNASATPFSGPAPSHFRIFEDGRLLQPEDYPIQRALREGRAIRNYEERLVYDDGTAVDLLGNVVPLRNPNGSVRGAVAAFVDVTKLKSVEAEIRALNSSLETKVRVRTARMAEALQELETFAYTVAHDLRGPLRAMSQFTDILVEDYAPRLGAEGEAYARRIGEAAERMDRLTRDLLEYSRVARTHVALEPLNIRPVVDEVLASLQSDVRQSGGKVDVALGSESVNANRFLLCQALTNLIGNAVKFSRPGVPPEVIVRCSPADSGRLRLWVEDRGIGIDPSHFPKLFQVFERLDPQGPYKGTGIGLAIVRKAVERMSGKVGVESEMGKGSRFWIELPSVRP
jgi:PAS domain S-box-containing protein